MKRYKAWIGILLCAALLIAFAGSSGMTVKAGITSDTIKDMQSQIANAQKEVSNLKDSLSDVQQMVKNLEKEKKDLNNYVTELDATLAQIEGKIADLNNRITEKEAEIDETAQKLSRALEQEEEQYDSMSRRIQFIYENGGMHILGLLLKSENLADLLNRTTYVNAVATYDREMLDEFIANREYIALCEEQLQVEKEYLDAVKAGVENEQAAVETLIRTKKQEIEKYEKNISTQEKAIKEYEADITAQNEIIKQLEKAVEDEKKKILLSNGKVPSYDGGTFYFPLESYTRISDDYGYRIHPILNVKQFHNGVDFAAPKGTKIYAAYDGIVVAATYSSSMGNYVMIDHGGGLYTIYMHASALYVSKDDVVVGGEHIAAVGSTGRSTGNHLHFTVRKNGDYVSPWDYLSE